MRNKLPAPAGLKVYNAAVQDPEAERGKERCVNAQVVRLDDLLAWLKERGLDA